MASDRPVIQVSTTGLVLTVALILGSLIVLTSLNPGVAIVLVIFAFIFGNELLEYVTTELGNGTGEGGEQPMVQDETAVEDDGDEDALALLRRRYASGTLSDEEFERKLGTLVETETLRDVERHLGGPTTGDENGRERTGADRDLERSTE